MGKKLEKVKKMLDGERDKKSYYMGSDYNSDANIRDNLKPGEIFVDKNDKKWTNKNGVIVSVPKVSRKELVDEGYIMPYTCPKCNKPLKAYVDKHMWKKEKMCLDCVTDRDTKMKAAGTFKAWEKERIKNSLYAYLRDMKQKNEDLLKQLDKNYIEFVENSKGSTQKWTQTKAAVEATKNNLQKNIDEITKYLKRIDEEEKALKEKEKE